jgi:hypothetical protein
VNREQRNICFTALVLLITGGNNKEFTADFVTIFIAVIYPVGPSGYINRYGIINRFRVAGNSTAAKGKHIDSRPVILDMPMATLTARDCLEPAHFCIKAIKLN